MAKNTLIEQRLAGIQQQLIGGYRAGAPHSSATKGAERQMLIDTFLSQVFPTPFRFGTGDATDSQGARSGQLDVVIEFPYAPSLPTLGASPRLYLAESVGAVVEVKSNLADQWGEAVASAKALRPITRRFSMSMTMGLLTPYIPYFVVGYVGWKQLPTLQANLTATPEISGALIIDPGFFVSSPDFNYVTATGPWALWGLIRSLHIAMTGLKAAATDPMDYAV